MGLITAAAITTAIALGGLALLLRRAADWRPLALAFVLALPLQPLVFYLVRLPLDGFVKTMFGLNEWVAALSMLYAPLTEEPAKWLVATVPAVRRAITRAPVPVALAVGLGFGVGEIWFLAHALATSPDVPEAPFWMYAGFMVERLEVCFLHGAFVALPFVQLARRGSFWLGGAVGVALHFLLNLPIYFAQIDWLGLGAVAWVSLLIMWVAGFVVGGALMVRRLARATRAT
jgi:hypothetical protein